MSVGEILRELRISKNLSIDELAEALGLTHQAVWNYENNIRVPKDEIKKKIADFYNVTVDEIFFKFQVNN